MASVYYHTVGGSIRGQTAATRRDYLTDALGSVTATTNSAAQVENTYRAKPYGAILAKAGSAADPRYLWTGGTGSRRTDRRFVAQYNLSRHYICDVGLWSTVDLLWPGEAAYAYVRCSPTRYVDPAGEAPCDGRTKKYCDTAKEWGNKNFGYNCFCRVSGMICDYINMPCYLFPSGLRQLCEKCKPWAECVNKCLFDCVIYHKGCSPSSGKCWERALRAPDPLFGDPGSPCMQIWDTGCIRWDDDKRHDDCCRSMVFCEQEQLGYCNTGPCGSLDKGCSKLFEEIAKRFGFDFPFSGDDPARQKAAYKLCCKRRVWQEPLPLNPRMDIRPFGA